MSRAETGGGKSRWSDIPEPIEEVYKGDFNKTRISLNDPKSHPVRSGRTECF